MNRKKILAMCGSVIVVISALIGVPLDELLGPGSGNGSVSEYTDYLDYDGAKIPVFSDNDYYEVNDSVPMFSDADIQRARTKVWETYSELDRLGRCGPAYANLCAKLRPTEERDEIGSVKPSGWHTYKYSGLVEGNYLYNRSHLIAYMLAGENANNRNLITGTRHFNADSMLYLESQVDKYMDLHPKNHVLYRVTPVFEGTNLVAAGVLMEAYSIEDRGVLSFCTFVYNVQPGVVIDYATGESRLE